LTSSSKLRDWILLVFCNLIWASQFVLLKLVQVQLGPVAATAFPMALATLCLVPIVFWERRSIPRKSSIQFRDILQFILIGVLGQVVAQLFVTWGVRYSPASNAALIMLTLPVVTAIMAYFILRERMSGIRWLSFAVAIVGVLECSGIDWHSLNFKSSIYLVGNLLVFGSVIGSAFYNVYSKKLLERYTPLEVLLYSYYAVIAVLLPITRLLEPQVFSLLGQLTPSVWIGLVALALFQYFLSMVIFLNVLTRLDATQASLSNYMIPFFGVVIAAIVLHEKLTANMVLGGSLVLASTLLVTVFDDHLQQKAAAKIT
jgi:drug/metabolite transporter (DMT)-like permease